MTLCCRSIANVRNGWKADISIHPERAFASKLKRDERSQVVPFERRPVVAGKVAQMRNVCNGGKRTFL